MFRSKFSSIASLLSVSTLSARVSTNSDSARLRSQTGILGKVWQAKSQRGKVQSAVQTSTLLTQAANIILTLMPDVVSTASGRLAELQPK
jgi:hypothetical protein